jgi:hypothetical protein
VEVLASDPHVAALGEDTRGEKGAGTPLGDSCPAPGEISRVTGNFFVGTAKGIQGLPNLPPVKALVTTWGGESRQPDPVLRTRLLREVSTLSRCEGALLLRLLAGKELTDIATDEGIRYITVYKRYRRLLKTLKRRLTAKTTSPAMRCSNARRTTRPGMSPPQCSTRASVLAYSARQGCLTGPPSPYTRAGGTGAIPGVLCAPCRLAEARAEVSRGAGEGHEGVMTCVTEDVARCAKALRGL